MHVVQSLNSPFLPPHIGAEPGRSKRRTLPFDRPGSAPIWGGKKGEFRDWTNMHACMSPRDPGVETPPWSALRQIVFL